VGNVLGAGEYAAALEVLAELEKRFPRAIRPKQLRALALSRRGQDGDVENAQMTLGTLYELGEHDPETIGIYARTWMDRYSRSGDVLHLRKSRDLYAEAFESARDDYYTGINAASKSVLLGTPSDLERARVLGEQVQQIVGTAPVANDYWKSATVAEVQLIQGNFEQAGKLYAAAVSAAPSERGSHQSTWTQACRLMATLKPSAMEREQVRQAFAHLPDCAPQ
jgi:tetratricopeptide (TPR) repeat protein